MLVPLLFHSFISTVCSYSENWSGVCESGLQQSPINIVRYDDQDEGLILDVDEIIELDDQFAYFDLNLSKKECEAYLNDSVLQITGSFGDITRQPNEDQEQDKKYSVTGLAIHTPSEHQIDNENYPLEVQIFLNDTDNLVLVLAVLHDQDGVDNDFLSELKGCYEDGDKLDLDLEFPSTKKIGRYFSYKGSLTTPPCTENITWIVWKTIQSGSKSQINFFKDLTGSNNRPIQDLNSREIYYYQGSDDFSSGVTLTYLLVFIIFNLF